MPSAANPGKVLGPPEILMFARSEFQRLGQIPLWREAFVWSTPDAPLLVGRLDQTDTYYYIVQFRTDDAVTGRLRLDAHTGEYGEAIGIERKGETLARYFTAEQIRERVLSQRVPSPGGTLPPVSIDPFPVWKPCRESFSAFLPFYRVLEGAEVQYHRLDGKVFEELTFGAGL